MTVFSLSSEKLCSGCETQILLFKYLLLSFYFLLLNNVINVVRQNKFGVEMKCSSMICFTLAGTRTCLKVDCL